jgi:uncharacterized protein YegP (UPF0339 family)
MYFTIRENQTNKWWYWQMKAANHEIIAHGEGYTTKAGCLHVIGLVDGGRNLPVYLV